MPSIEINGVAVSAPEGASILDAARLGGIDVPTLCYLKDRSAVSSCRVCVVDVEGIDAPVPACSTIAAEGMRVTTDSPRLATYRRVAVELLLADHGISSLDDCGSCVADGACELQALALALGVAVPPAVQGEAGDGLDDVSGEAAGFEPVLDANPFLSYDASLCIACQRCVGACNEAARNHVLRTGRRGARTAILAPFGDGWRATDCESCGVCAQACPTGALVVKRRRGYRASETKRVRTTCPHCGVGCQIDLVVSDGRIVDAEGADGPANKGLLCVKGRSASFDFVASPDRLTTPLVRSAETGELEPATWDEALDLVAERLGGIKRDFGSDSLAAFACSRSTNEDVYMLQKLARAALGTNNVDSCARV